MSLWDWDLRLRLERDCDDVMWCSNVWCRGPQRAPPGQRTLLLLIDLSWSRPIYRSSIDPVFLSCLCPPASFLGVVEIDVKWDNRLNFNCAFGESRKATSSSSNDL
ncbi:uncharacterized protein EI97DRAFT_217224 [Westerdykella ornata]|uniref:Uncharacterized protein n=1 Tax=Westerdykella ornata TaxID=318751 RepID=A0A6A6JR21_WESOR|nr:uncharacterized protein EI97DRAFT_217224 [Westerdykella ornata]KAF2278715.1 hypothetical protein EI97DRAFT_217224 [Westerdykella ornata]